MRALPTRNPSDSVFFFYRNEKNRRVPHKSLIKTMVHMIEYNYKLRISRRRENMKLVKNKQVQILGFTFLMMLLICVMPIREVHGETVTKLSVDGTCVTGTVSGGSYSYYFVTPSNGMVHLGVNNPSLNLSLYQDAGYKNKITIGDRGYVDLKAGTYYVVVSGTGTYEISVNFDATPDHDPEPNDTMETAIPLASGVSVEGNAYSAFDDVDWYKVVLTTKSYINFELYTNNQVIFICDSIGKVVGTMNQSGPMIFDKPGVYYIRVEYLQQYSGYYKMKADIVEFPTPNEITSAVYRGSRRVDLTWSKSNYADGYQLFYKTSENGTWNPITTINSGNTTSYIHYYGPSEGQTYYYGVMAFRKDKVYGELYNQEDAAGYKVTATKLPATSNANVNNNSVKSLSKVTGVKAKKKKPYNIIRWKKNSIATGYKVYRKEGSGSFKLIKTTSATSFKDKKVKKGKKYTYKIKAYYKNYTYNASQKKYTNKIVTSKYSKAVSVKR